MNTWEIDRYRLLAARLEAIEAQLEIVSERVGVPWVRPDTGGIPPAVRALVAQGKQSEAILELRKQFEMSLLEAKKIVDDLAAGREASIMAAHR